MATLKSKSIASVGALFIALGTTVAAQAAIVYGESKLLGDGFVRSFVTLDDIGGKPLDIGVSFTQGVLSLPTGDDVDDISLQLSLPPEASSTPFNHLEFTYRPHGYPNVPIPPVFSVPRFATNFFVFSPEERALICPNPDTSSLLLQCVGDELEQALKTPEPGTVPEGLVPPQLATSGHGVLYNDPDIFTPVVLGQQPLTSAYDYGYFDGRLSLMDIVATKAFLETQPNATVPIKLPTLYSQSGYYPTKYRVTYDATSQEYRISYTGLTYRSSTPESVPEPSFTWALLALGAWGVVFPVRNKLKKQQLAS